MPPENDEPAVGIEWLGHDSPPPARAALERSRRSVATAVGLLLALIAGLGFFTISSHERVESPLANRTASQERLEEQRAAAPNRFLTSLATMPPITMILPQFAGEPTIRIDSGPGVMIDDAAYGELHSFAVDASGTWLAALSGNGQVGNARLWLGPVRGGVSVVADDVRGFAWHETEPAQLAVGTVDDTGARVVATGLVDGEQFVATPAFESAHHVEHWGDWGFVVRPEVTDQGFHLLSPTGAEIATGYRGDVVGAIDNQLIVNAAGGRQSPLLIFTPDGRAWPIFSLTDVQVVQSVARGGAGGTVAVMVSHLDDDVHEIRVFPPTGVPPTRIPSVRATGAMTWSPDGSTLIFVREGPNRVTEVVQYDLATGSTVATPVASSPQINHAISTIAVGS